MVTSFFGLKQQSHQSPSKKMKDFGCYCVTLGFECCKKKTFSISLDYLNDLQNGGKKNLANCPMSKSHSFNIKTYVPKNKTTICKLPKL